jgi:hypothetical protein
MAIIGNVIYWRGKAMKKEYDFLPEYKAERLSLIYTLHAISHLSKDEIELLKTLRRDLSLLDKVTENNGEVFPKIQKILSHFNLNSIQEVIETVESYNLFELCNF